MNVPDDILVAREKYLHALEAAERSEQRIHSIHNSLMIAQDNDHAAKAALRDAEEILQTVAMGWLRGKQPL